MRSYVINKILCTQYRLGRVIGRKKASRFCAAIDRAFTALFGREVRDAKS